MSIILRDSWQCQNCHNQKLVNKEKSFLASTIAYKSINNPDVCVATFINPVSDYVEAFLPREFANLETPQTVYFRQDNNRNYILASRKSDPNATRTAEDGYLKFVSDKLKAAGHQYMNVADLESYKPEWTKHLQELSAIHVTKNPVIKWNYVIGLHVHHSFYQIGKLPWEYDQKFLTTLCIDCHAELHSQSTIPVLNEKGDTIGNFHCCQRCNGRGYLPKYNHIANGICFQCNGNRFVELS